MSGVITSVSKHLGGEAVKLQQWSAIQHRSLAMWFPAISMLLHGAMLVRRSARLGSFWDGVQCEFKLCQHAGLRGGYGGWVEIMSGISEGLRWDPSLLAGLRCEATRVVRGCFTSVIVLLLFLQCSWNWDWIKAGFPPAESRRSCPFTARVCPFPSTHRLQKGRIVRTNPVSSLRGGLLLLWSENNKIK